MNVDLVTKKALKGKYHANSMSFQNPKNVHLLTETKNNNISNINI